MVLGGRPPGRVGHCQGAFSFNISPGLFIHAWIMYNLIGKFGCRAWKRPHHVKRGVWSVRFGLLIILSFLSKCKFLGPSLYIGWGFFIGYLHAERRWLHLASVNLRNGESQDSLLKRFRKKVVKSQVLSTVRRKRWFVSKSEQRRMEKKKAIRRIKRRTFTKEGE